MSSPVKMPDSFEAPAQEMYIKDAGIYSEGRLSGPLVYKAPVPATDKKAEIGESVSVEIVTKNNFKHSGRVFKPESDPDKVKFFSDYYENGVTIRKKTAVEQIQGDWMELSYFFGQLAAAHGHSWDAVRNLIFPKVQAFDFKGIIDAFNIAFVIGKPQKLFNFKLVWNNNQNKKSSFLSFPKASSYNVAFEMNIPNQGPTLVFSKYEEEKCLKALFKFAPKSKDGMEAMPSEEIKEITGGFKPIVTDTDTLF